MSLSPLDPLHYAMLGTHSQSFLCDGNYAEAATWAERAARAPGAHHLAATTAAFAHHLNDDEEKARYWAHNVLARRPDMHAESFFNSFPFAESGEHPAKLEALRVFDLAARKGGEAEGERHRRRRSQGDKPL